MNLRKIIGVLIITLTATSLATAQGYETQESEQWHKVTSAYRSYVEVSPSIGLTPAVVEVEMDLDSIQRFNFAVLNKTTNTFEPYYFRSNTLIDKIPLIVGTPAQVSGVNNLADSKYDTHTDFVLPTDGSEGVAEINISNPEEIKSSSLSFFLDRNVAYPTHVEIRAVVDGAEQIIVGKTKVKSGKINFPETISKEWKVTFNYAQPLRISELVLSQEGLEKNRKDTIRFLAQPETSYEIYFKPDRLERADVSESGNLSSAKDVVRILQPAVLKNNNYKIADVDKDGVADVYDNCVSIPNSDQKDLNGNGRGYVCDDFDYDRVINSKDNCVNNPNRNQADEDGDGIGDVCDGEESRLTEKMPWLSWLGMGLAILVLVTLIAITARSKPSVSSENNSDTE